MKIQVLYCCNNNTVTVVAQGLLHDIERYYNERIARGLQGPPGPPGPPGYSRLFGSSTNITDIMEYIRSKVTLNTVSYNVPLAVVSQKKRYSVIRAVNLVADKYVF